MLGVFVWVYWERRYFIFKRGSMDNGWEYMCTWFRKEFNAPNSERIMVQIATTQQIAYGIYYNVCVILDRSNWFHQDIPEIEKKLGVCDWLKRFNISVF